MFTIALAKGLPAAHESGDTGGSNVHLEVYSREWAQNYHLTGSDARILVQGGSSAESGDGDSLT